MVPAIGDIVTSAGETIGGKYRLVRKLDEGGMGFVYEAEHLSIGGRVAVKFLHADYSYDASSLERFRREARSAAAIGHDAIIDVYDMDSTDDGLPYIVMELLKGQTLRQRLANEPQLELPFVAYIACQVLSALAAAHAQKIVHRDLKPENIFLVEGSSIVPSVKLLDFGISYAMEGSSPTEEKVTRLTRSGVLLGTPEYMSPEQARGIREVGYLSDIYSMGLIIYECLTGNLAFSGVNYNEIIARILTTEPLPPSEVRADLPPELEAAVVKSIVKDPKERIQSATELFCLLLPYVDDKVVGSVTFPDGLTAEDVESLKATDKYPMSSDTVQDMVPIILTPKGQTGTLARSSLDSRRLFYLTMLAVVGGAVIALTILFFREAPQQREHPDGPAAVAVVPMDADLETSHDTVVDAATNDEAAEKVLIELSGLPAGARVFVNDVPIDTNPLQFVKGSPMFTLKIEAEGYETYRRMLTPDASRSHEVGMELLDPFVVSPGKWTKRAPWTRPLGNKIPPTSKTRVDAGPAKQVQKVQKEYHPHEW